MPDLLGPNPWRPEGWVNPEDLPEDGPLDGLDDCGIYEAGADAMLEALKEGGIVVHTKGCMFFLDDGYILQQREFSGPGHLIFIPEAQG